MFQGESDEKEDEEEKRTQVERWNAPTFSSDQKGDWEREPVSRNRLVLAWKQSQWPTIVKTEEREVAAEPDKVMVTDDLDKYGLVQRKGSEIRMD